MCAVFLAFSTCFSRYLRTFRQPLSRCHSFAAYSHRTGGHTDTPTTAPGGRQVTQHATVADSARGQSAFLRPLTWRHSVATASAVIWLDEGHLIGDCAWRELSRLQHNTSTADDARVVPITELPLWVWDFPSIFTVVSFIWVTSNSVAFSLTVNYSDRPTAVEGEVSSDFCV
jgi:hypothetical protein